MDLSKDDLLNAGYEVKKKSWSEEEDKLLQMEEDEKDLMDDEMNEDEITEEDLKRALKDVRSKKTILKLNHKQFKGNRQWKNFSLGALPTSTNRRPEGTLVVWSLFTRNFKLPIHITI